jgi:hypothetical protein
VPIFAMSNRRQDGFSADMEHSTVSEVIDINSSSRPERSGVEGSAVSLGWQYAKRRDDVPNG